jgi:hypothetical protein
VTHGRFDGKFIEGEKLPGAGGPAMIEWPDASSAETLEHWPAHFRRKNWVTLGNEIEIVALFEGREARRQAAGQWAGSCRVGLRVVGLVFSGFQRNRLWSAIEARPCALGCLFSPKLFLNLSPARMRS